MKLSNIITNILGKKEENVSSPQEYPHFDISEALKIRINSAYQAQNLSEKIEESKADTIKPEVVLIHNEDLTSNFGRCDYDSETNTLTVEVAPYVQSWTPHPANLHRQIMSGQPLDPQKMTSHDGLVIDVFEMPACKYYGPNRDDIEAGAVQVPNWPFIRAKKVASCSNQALIAPEKFGSCHAYPNLTSCRGYEASDWENLTIVYADDSPALALQVKYYSIRMPRYRIVEPGQEVFFTTESFEEIQGRLVNSVDTLRAQGAQVNIVEETDERVTYFKTVLAEAGK